MSAKAEIYKQVTDRIIEALETANEFGWVRPWSRTGTTHLPVRLNGQAYRGTNAVQLLFEGALRGYDSNVWGTYKGWATKNCQVRKGEKGTKVILWKPTSRKVKDDDGTEGRKASLYTTTYTVFNAEQVDGYVAPEKPEPRTLNEIEQAARAFLASTGSVVRHGGDAAFYSPSLDVIQLPVPEAFRDEVSYLATSAHEHVHWTGHKSRCNRDFANRFGSEQYAFEELIAELGAAFLCAELELSNEPRADHADYIKNWISVLKNDSSAIITAASQAQKAVTFLHGEKSDNETVDDSEPVLAEVAA